MGTTPEGKVKAKVKAILNKHDIYYFMPATGGYGRSGVPDFICCVSGKFLAVECKAGNNKTTALQDREIGRIRQQGGAALVIDEHLLDYLEGFLTGLNNFDDRSQERMTNVS
jgi:hypothetical protein